MAASLDDKLYCTLRKLVVFYDQRKNDLKGKILFLSLGSKGKNISIPREVVNTFSSSFIYLSNLFYAITEAYLEPSQASAMDLFCKNS